MSVTKKFDHSTSPEKLTNPTKQKQRATTIIAGTVAPSFVLPDQFGTKIYSAKLLAHRPLIVFFFRALWCEFCVRELLAVEQASDLLRARGAAIVGISRYNNEDVISLDLDTAITFPMLNDGEGTVADAFGLRSPVPLELAAAHGSDWAPIPARFVIAPNGVVAYGDADPDYTNRPDPAELAPVILRINAGKGF